jgi:CPA2 family monovalent cation:H+ antiporter-2
VDLWTALLDIIILLTAAVVLGGLCERLRQSAILGYLLAGTLLGPHALNCMPNHEAVASIAELGVAMLLFAIGLEFSWRRLRSIGDLALRGGTAQVMLTMLASASVCLVFGLGWRSAVAVGAMIALSSTACVLRLLLNRAEIDSVHGRNALGILLLQDITVVPMVILVTALGGGSTLGQAGWAMAQAIGAAVLFAGASYVLLYRIAPLLLSVREAARNRELPILLAIVMVVGAAWAAHRIGLSPAIGAFVAGILLAGSPFATVIRADVAPLRTLFVTLFFSSIGMLADPRWVVDHWVLVAATVAAIVVGKTLLTCGAVWLFRRSLGYAMATGLCLGQVGEFSFVLAKAGLEAELITNHVFELMVSATIVTLFLTPYLVAVAPRVAAALGELRPGGPRGATESGTGGADHHDHLVIVGFGPAGQRVAEGLMKHHKHKIVVVELNPKSAAVAQSYGLETHIGDATRAEMLERLRVETARVVAVTLPDPTTSRQVIEQVRSLSPDTMIVVRARYHIHRWRLVLAGAQVVADEEDGVGMEIASEVRKLMPDDEVERSGNR